MKLTITEAELLKAKKQRRLAAMDVILRDMAGASVTNANLAPQNAQPCHGEPCRSEFDGFGNVRSCYAENEREAQRRRKMHDELVLPEPSQQRGYVYTRLDAFGHPGARKLVSVKTFLCRYYLWQYKERAMPWNVVLKRDRAAIRRITGKRHLRGPWRCFFFGAGKEIVHAFDFSDWVLGPDGKRMRRPVDD